MAKSSAARIKANAKYKSIHYRQVNVAVAPDMATAWQEAATAAGQSMRGYIIDAVEQRRNREATSQPDAHAPTSSTP